MVWRRRERRPILEYGRQRPDMIKIIAIRQMRQINFEGGPGAVKASFSASMALRSDFITLDMAPTAGKACLRLDYFPG